MFSQSVPVIRCQL